MYQHELYDLFLYYNSSAAVLAIGHHSHGLLRVQKAHGVAISSDVNYAMDQRNEQLFNFSSWKQWNPQRNEFVHIRSDVTIKPVCVDQNFGFCTSGILQPSIGNVGLHSLDILEPEHTTINIRSIRFKLRSGTFDHIRPVYELMSETQTIPYYLYHRNGKWRVGTEIGSETETIMEMESDVMRVEYESQSNWYVVGRVRNAPQLSAIRRLECYHQLAADINCQTAGIDICENGGSCHVDSTGISSCTCLPDFTGIRCQEPVAQCKEPFSSNAPSFAFSSREGSIASTFCRSGRVVISVCNGNQWLYTSDRCRADPTMSPPNTTSEIDFARSRRDPAGKIALVIVSLVGLQLIFPFLCYCCISCCKFDENKLTSEEKLPSQKRLAKFLRACSAFFYLSWWAWFAFLIYYLGVWHGHVALDGTTVWSAVAILAIICICLLHVVVLCESICSREYEYLTKLKDILLAEEQITRMKSERPTIKFKADCWHPETRTRTV